MSFLITMSQKELHRLEVIQKILDRRLNAVQAAGVLGISRSQMHRLLKAYETDGTPGSYRRSASNQATGVTARIFATPFSIWSENGMPISARPWLVRS